MSNTLEIKVDTSEVEAAIKKMIESELPSKLTAALTKAVLKVEADSKKNCPAGTGTLRQSITHTVEETNEGYKGYVGTNLEYAPYVHQGTGIYAKDGNGRKEVPWKYQDAKGEWHTTKGIKPTPFIQDAVDSNRDAILSMFKGVLGNG